MISNTLKTSSELNDLRREGMINRSNADTSIRQLHEHISEMEMSGHPNLLPTLLSLNDSIKIFQHSSDCTYSHLGRIIEKTVNDVQPLANTSLSSFITTFYAPSGA